MTENLHRPVLVVDFGAQYAQLIARRVREAQVYSEVVPHTATVPSCSPATRWRSCCPAARRACTPRARPAVDPALFEAGVPVFGICYGFQAMAQALGGTVAHTGAREFGRTELTPDGGVLHADLPAPAPGVDVATATASPRRPPGSRSPAPSAGAPVAAFEDVERRFAGVQYHPEVAHSPHGQEILRRFLHDIAGIRPQWTIASIVDEQVESHPRRRSATAGRSAGCPAASTPRSPPPWCSAPSATG